MSSPTDRSGLRRTARMSSVLLAQALDELVARHGDHAVIDVRADAYGHGAHEIEARAQSAGVHHFVREADHYSHAPDDADAAALIDATLIYGFDGERTPLLSLEGEVIATKTVPEGTAVSYGYRYRTSQRSTLALVGLGYADGVPRTASSRATVRIGQHRGVVAGSIAMDQLVVDVGSFPVDAGDAAVLWDDRSSLLEWSSATGLPLPALTTRLGARIERVWSDE